MNRDAFLDISGEEQLTFLNGEIEKGRSSEGISEEFGIGNPEPDE